MLKRFERLYIQCDLCEKEICCEKFRAVTFVSPERLGDRRYDLCSFCEDKLFPSLSFLELIIGLPFKYEIEELDTMQELDQRGRFVPMSIGTGQSPCILSSHPEKKESI